MRNCAPRETLGIGNFHAPHFQSSIQHANINLLFFADFFFLTRRRTSPKKRECSRYVHRCYEKQKKKVIYKDNALFIRAQD